MKQDQIFKNISDSDCRKVSNDLSNNWQKSAKFGPYNFNTSD